MKNKNRGDECNITEFLSYILSTVFEDIKTYYYNKKHMKREPIIEQGDFIIHVPPSHAKFLEEHGYKVKRWNGKEYV